MKLFGEPPVGQIRDGQLGRGNGSNPVGRAQTIGRLPLGAPRRDEAARFYLFLGRGVAHEDAQFVVLEEHDVVRLVENTHLDELGADGNQDQTQVRVGSLVDVEVVVRRQWCHLQVDVVEPRYLVQGVAGQTMQQLVGG